MQHWRCQISCTFSGREATRIASHVWLILLIRAKLLPKTSVSQGLHLHMLQSSYTHYFQQSKQKKQLAFKKPQAVAARCVFGPWCGAVITTFRSQPNIETTEEQMFAFPRRVIFQETRGRSTKYWQSMRIRNQSSKGLCPCWNWNSAPSPARSAWSISGMVGNNPVWGLQAEGCWQEKTTRRKMA